MTSTPPPTSINGGCLCGSIRYTITFPATHDFTTACSTCQCSQCRANTGALIFRCHAVPTSAVAFTSTSTLARYHASPPCERGFCTRCGSLLFWRDEREDIICLTVGCFEKEALRKWGRLLTDAKRHLFCEEEIEGVTDHLQGERWKGDSEGEGAELMSS